MRNYHSSILAQKLERKGCPKEICERVIADCKKLGMINDEDAILRELRRGYGPRAIEYKLNLSRAEVRQTITRDMQRERIRELLPKLGIRTLQRRGFDFELISQEVNVVEIFSLQEVD